MKTKNRPKILFLDKAHPFLENYLTEKGAECHTDTTSPVHEIAKIIGQYQGLVMRSRFALDQQFLDMAVGLRFIAREGVGLEHIAVEYAAGKGIEVLTSPEGSRDTVAEHAIGLLLCLMNNLCRADSQVRNGEWIREGNRAVELKGKTVGILGYGNMGAALARRLSGFEARVMAYDRYKRGFADAYVEEVALEKLQSEADIVSLHFPYSADNHYYVNHAFLMNFNKDIFLVNTARGLILETEALVSHLKSGKVKGAALDVIEYEETSFDKFKLEKLPPAFEYLRKADNVVLTPHIAGWSFESKEKHAQVLAGKIGRVLFG
ncbi:MAG: hydroxyacid dehydrogenase [Lewinellaceae bacterium]|nr:hydroxyacid dehydrogenase [Saprospiraceae bacterium]MCB9339894.1 hydroxyacid dehydrogenase [Lewinellaceae bacterium]